MKNKAKKFRLLDLYCGGGGASEGYFWAGFTDITGVDIEPQPNYPYKFVQADALAFLEKLIKNGKIKDYDFIHASPPCLAHSVANFRAKAEGKVYVDLIAKTRELLQIAGINYCIENVPNAPIRRDLILQGAMFNLKVIRVRHFELSFFVLNPPITNQRGEVKAGKAITVAGGGYKKEGAAHKGKIYKNKTQRENRNLVMCTPWMRTMKEVNNAIPPPYTAYIGGEFLKNYLKNHK